MIKTTKHFLEILLAAFTLVIGCQAQSAQGSIYCVDGLKLGFPERLLLTSLQALANSNAPVFFVMQRGEDSSWRSAMEKQLGQKFEGLSSDQALQRFGANTPQVIYDPTKRWSISIATTLAGIHGALLTDHEIAGHSIAFDCRNRWTNKLEAYRWAISELLPQCNHSQLCYLDEGLSFLRDYAMQQKQFVLNLDPLNDWDEMQLLDGILDQFPPQTRVFGWASGAFARSNKGQNGVTVEAALVRRLSRRGMMLVPCDFAANISFYTRTAPSTENLRQTRLKRNLKLEAGKRYVMLVVSDGDNVQYDLGTMRAQWQKARPEIPLAWTISPQLAEIAPAVLQTYFQEAAERGGWDEFVAGPSGYAYVNPGGMGAAGLATFIAATRTACQTADIRSIVILDDSSRPPTQVGSFINAYALAKFDGLWLAAMPDYLGVTGDTAFVNERFRLSRDNPGEIAQQVKQVRVENPFVMVYVDAWKNVGDTIRDFSRGLDDSCVVVSPAEMADLIRQWVSKNAGLQQVSARPEALEGLEPVENEDGEFSVVTRNGSSCWLLPKRETPHYFYLDVNDGFHGGAMEIELEYFDMGTGDIALDYDSTDVRSAVEGAYKRPANIIHRTNSGGWQEARFRITDARFANRENGGADFRFYNGGDDLLIRAVRVRRVER